ncbi:hypothetical protein SDC9_185444 [bioreactor metagenome]|uniref:Uncharacterized protein n=1 Tax=bioreactor metagenome TaxID=1076179 RepID=A0A645HRC4_9ZZZZ
MNGTDRIKLPDNDTNIESRPAKVDYQRFLVRPDTVFYQTGKHGRQGFRHNFNVFNIECLTFVQFYRSHKVVDLALNIEFILLAFFCIELTDGQCHRQ